MHRRSYKGKKFSRTAAPRRAMLRSLATSVILYEKVETTKTKAKEIQRIVEKLITCSKKGTLASLRKVDSYLLDENASKKLVLELSGLYKDRKGGYTRVLNTGYRTGDSAPMARIELVDTDKLLKDQKLKTKDQKGEEKKEAKKPVAKKAEKSKTKAKKEPAKKKLTKTKVSK